MQVKRHSLVSSQLPADQDDIYIYPPSNEYIEEQFYRRAVENIEGKLDKLASFIYLQGEPQYYGNKVSVIELYNYIHCI